MSSPSNSNGGGLHRSLSSHLGRLHMRTPDSSTLPSPDISEKDIGKKERLRENFTHSKITNHVFKVVN